MRIGYFLSCEQFGPRELVDKARRAEEAGFQDLWISDHYHPWNDEQGQSPFVWTVIGQLAEATSRMRVTTAVTCPTIRIHPAVIAQAAATATVALDGRFNLGVGTGENLNEHILGDHWPEAEERIEMLEEAIEVMRMLWQGGTRSHRGRHYRVENARIYTLPPEPPPVVVSGFGRRSVELAGRVGDGYAITMPDRDLISHFHSAGGQGKPVQAGAKVCWDEDEQRAIDEVHRLWPNEVLPGELAQVLPTPAHFEQATELVTKEMVAESVPCGPDLDKHLQALQQYADAGADELYVQQIGPDLEGFFSTYSREVLPKFT
ncbi:MAG TPA: TIGR03557 family F420-dependent LLM class oxidoreductase [Thermoleophilaceae bacterium]